MPFIILFSLVFLVFFYALKLLLIYSESNKPKPVYINPIFGQISRPVIKEATTSAEYNYTLDTIEGQPITATQSAKIYYLPPTNPRFGYKEKVYLMAKTLGFDTEVIKHKLVDKIYLFSDDIQSLKVDITNFNFNYEYKLSSGSSLFENTIIPPKNQIEEKATEFFRTIGRYPEELAQGKTNIIYHHYNSLENKLFVTERTQDANVVEVDYYRPDIEDYPVIPPKYFNSQNYVIMVFNQDSYKIIKAEINFFEKSNEQIGLYPVKMGDEAWKELKSGKGMVFYNKPENKDILIKKMLYGYLDPKEYQDYLQPVYVFLGDNDFIGYVPAIKEQYFSN